MAIANSRSAIHRGWHYDAVNGRLAAEYNGTEAFDFDADDVAVALATTFALATTITAGGLTVTAGGITVTAGGLTVTAGTTNIDGIADFAADVKFNLTITAGADGVGADGEQLTSGGAAAEVDWAAAACLREFKNIGEERTDDDAVLATLTSTPVFDFQYKSRDEYDGHVMSTGDIETTYTGIMADDAPWATHHHGKILNPINTFGHTVMALRALDRRLEALEAA